MKKKVILLALAFGLSSIPVALSATTTDQDYIELNAHRPGIPPLLSIVRPVVSNEFVGSNVALEFTIDARGRPRWIRMATPAPSDLARPLIKAIELWEFAPVMGPNGAAVPTKVRLPVKVVP